MGLSRLLILLIGLFAMGIALFMAMTSGKVTSSFMETTVFWISFQGLLAMVFLIGVTSCRITAGDVLRAFGAAFVVTAVTITLYIRSRGTELSRKRGAEIAATLSGAKDFKAAAKALGFEAKETALISRGAPIPDVGVSADIDKVAFSLPVGGVSQPISTSDGTAIVKVTERDEATPEELKKDRETFRAELLNERRERFFSAYMNKARERTPIEVNNDVIRRTLNARGL